MCVCGVDMLVCPCMPLYLATAMHSRVGRFRQAHAMHMSLASVTALTCGASQAGPGHAHVLGYSDAHLYTCHDTGTAWEQPEYMHLYICPGACVHNAKAKRAKGSTVFSEHNLQIHSEAVRRVGPSSYVHKIILRFSAKTLNKAYAFHVVSHAMVPTLPCPLSSLVVPQLDRM